MIAALFVQTNGVYFGLPGVDPWDVKRDARRYCGPWPVVNHVKDGEKRRRLGSKEASATPLPFRDLLISIARSRESLKDHPWSCVGAAGV